MLSTPRSSRSSPTSAYWASGPSRSADAVAERDAHGDPQERPRERVARRQQVVDVGSQIAERVAERRRHVKGAARAQAQGQREQRLEAMRADAHGLGGAVDVPLLDLVHRATSDRRARARAASSRPKVRPKFAPTSTARNAPVSTDSISPDAGHERSRVPMPAPPNTRRYRLVVGRRRPRPAGSLSALLAAGAFAALRRCRAASREAPRISSAQQRWALPADHAALERNRRRSEARAATRRRGTRSATAPASADCGTSARCSLKRRRERRERLVAARDRGRAAAPRRSSRGRDSPETTRAPLSSAAHSGSAAGSTRKTTSDCAARSASRSAAPRPRQSRARRDRAMRRRRVMARTPAPAFTSNAVIESSGTKSLYA